MANQFVSREGDLENIFVSDYGMIDQYSLLGTLWTFGTNNNGALGQNLAPGITTRRSSPVQTSAGGTNWKLVSGGGYVCSGITTSGTLWLWGANVYGQLGDNSRTAKSAPVQTTAGGTNWKLVSCGNGLHTAAIKTDGTLWLWGRNDFGQLGDNTIANKSSPVQTVSGGTNWKQVACGFGTAAIKTDGTLWLWGAGVYGVLGDNTVTNRSSPVQTVSAGTNWKYVSGCSSGRHTAAIKTDGTLWTWGRNQLGQLGDNTITNRSSPVQTVAGGTNWKLIGSSLGNHTMAIKTDGTLWLWGSGTYGQLGDNTRTSKSSPVQTVSAGTNWKQVAGSFGTTAAIKTDNTLWTLGLNSEGTLGDNTSANKSSPVQTVSGGNNWKQVACLSQSTAAVKTDYS